MAAVGMKPPHRGHIDMIKNVVEKAAEQEATVSVFTGKKPRGSIGLEQSVPMLELFLKNEGIQLGDGPGEVKIVEVVGGNPFFNMVGAASSSPKNDKIYIFSSSDDKGRSKAVKRMIASFNKNNKNEEENENGPESIEDYIVPITPSLEGDNKLSATDMRQSIEDGGLRYIRKVLTR